jgi:hypothetical protein
MEATNKVQDPLIRATTDPKELLDHSLPQQNNPTEEEEEEEPATPIIKTIMTYEELMKMIVIGFHWSAQKAREMIEE